MARDREQIYEASDWFKEALQKNQVSVAYCILCYGFIVYSYPEAPQARKKSVGLH